MHTFNKNNIAANAILVISFVVVACGSQQNVGEVPALDHDLQEQTAGSSSVYCSDEQGLDSNCEVLPLELGEDSSVASTLCERYGYGCATDGDVLWGPICETDVDCAEGGFCVQDTCFYGLGSEKFASMLDQSKESV